MKTAEQLRDDALAIWRAGVDAVGAERLVRKVMHRSGDRLTIGRHEFQISDLRRIAVVGAGKAGAGMAAAVEEVLGPDVVREKVSGWVNVPADCVRPLQKIQLHAARDAGVNEPAQAGVEGARKILEIVADLRPDDLCLVLLSGGGSALLPAPVPPITLAEKQAVTRFLMHAGATIAELNTVRRRLSQIKGGKLAQAIRAGTALVLIISDVVGDPLETIASGPTVPDRSTDADALAVLKKFHGNPPDVPQAVLDYLGQATANAQPAGAVTTSIDNLIIGNNAVAVAAAAQMAASLGYVVETRGSAGQGEANEIGRELAEYCRRVRDAGDSAGRPACILSGGEPVVQLAKSSRPRKGGRNQQLVLAGLDDLFEDGLRQIVLLSGGTDGEDGPTDAAGAWADAQLAATARQLGLKPRDFLEINNAYAFFEQTGGLIKTGPTHTNVMDLRVCLVSPETPEDWAE